MSITNNVVPFDADNFANELVVQVFDADNNEIETADAVYVDTQPNFVVDDGEGYVMYSVEILGHVVNIRVPFDTIETLAHEYQFRNNDAIADAE